MTNTTAPVDLYADDTLADAVAAAMLTVTMPADGLSMADAVRVIGTLTLRELRRLGWVDVVDYGSLAEGGRRVYWTAEGALVADQVKRRAHLAAVAAVRYASIG